MITAILATIASLVLAVLPALQGPVRYDPSLAVLTATLIALVWYTFFAYVAAAKLEPSYVRVGLDRDGYELEPRIENPTRRSLRARIWMKVWAGGVPQEQSAFYSGADERFFGPEARLKGSVQAKEYFKVTRDDFGEEVPGLPEIFVMLRVKWTDDSDESGDTGPRYYRVPARGDVIAVVAKENIERLFPPCAGEIAGSGVGRRSGDSPSKQGRKGPKSMVGRKRCKWLSRLP